jgi:hypothetical protein
MPKSDIINCPKSFYLKNYLEHFQISGMSGKTAKLTIKLAWHNDYVDD